MKKVMEVDKGSYNRWLVMEKSCSAVSKALPVLEVVGSLELG